MKLTGAQKKYLKLVAGSFYGQAGQMSCAKSEWSNETMQQLRGAGLVEWSAPSHRARYVIITEAGRALLSQEPPHEQ